MDIYRLSSDIKFVNQVGLSLSLEERMKLELSLIKINEKEKYDQILFWGKIEGLNKDYYIAVGMRFKSQFEFPIKEFYWSSINFVFEKLKDFNPEYKDKVDDFRQYFTGQADKILINVEGGEQANEQEQPPQQEEGAEQQQKKQEGDSDEEKEVKVPPKPFTELDRLAYAVRSIENDCAITPVGAFKLTPTHELRYNDSFKGLQMDDLLKMKNYQHFRSPQVQDKKDQISRDDALFYFDFLDPIEKDVPKGCWSIQTDTSKTNVTVRNLIWPGFIGYHRSNSNIFGYIYIGNGLKNCDLPFLL